MAHYPHQKSKETKIQCIAAVEERSQRLDQIASHVRQQYLKLEARKNAACKLDRPKSEVETELKDQFENLRLIMSEMDISKVVREEICTLWQNTFVGNVLVPCSQKTDTIADAVASHSGRIKKREELDKKLKSLQDEQEHGKTVINDLMEKIKNYEVQALINDESITSLRADFNERERDFQKQLASKDHEIEALETAESQHAEALRLAQNRSKNLRKEMEKMMDEDQDKMDRIMKLEDKIALERAGHASLKSMYSKLEESHEIQEKKIESFRDEDIKKSKTILSLEVQLDELKINHGTLRTLVDGVEHLRTLTGEQARDIVAKDLALTEINSSYEELKTTASRRESRITSLEDELEQMTSDNIQLRETNVQQSQVLQTLQSQVEALNKQSASEKHAFAKAMDSLRLNCRMIADSEVNDRENMLSRAEHEYRVTKHRMHEGHRRSQRYLRNLIQGLEKDNMRKETLNNVMVDLVEQEKVSRNQKERTEIELRKQIDHHTESQQAFKVRTEAEKQLMQEEIATLKHQLQEQSDIHLSSTQELEDDVKEAREQNDYLRLELEKCNDVSTMHLQIIEYIYGNGLWKDALAIFNIRTRRLETELPGPSKLRVDFLKSRFHGYSSNRNLTAEEVARKVLRFIWLLEKESARRYADEYQDMIDIWRVWEDPISMEMDQKAAIFYILFDFSLHIILTARVKEVWPFLQWLALELLNALIRHGATEAHLKQVHDQILGVEVGPQAQIVRMGYGHLAEAVRLRMKSTGHDSPPLMLVAAMRALESETHHLICTGAPSSVEWQVSCSEQEGSIHIVSKAVQGEIPMILHRGDPDRYAFFRVKADAWLSINGGEDYWKVVRHDGKFYSWMLQRLVDKPPGFDEWKRKAIPSS